MRRGPFQKLTALLLTLTLLLLGLLFLHLSKRSS